MLLPVLLAPSPNSRHLDRSEAEWRDPCISSLLVLSVDWHLVLNHRFRSVPEHSPKPALPRYGRNQAKTKYRGLSATAAKAPPPVEMTCLYGSTFLFRQFLTLHLSISVHGGREPEWISSLATISDKVASVMKPSIVQTANPGKICGYSTFAQSTFIQSSAGAGAFYV